MKANFHKLFAVLMASLLLGSTTSWTLGKHYCMGRLMDVSFFDHAEDCGMNMDYSDSADSSFEKEDSCCDDEFVTVDGQDHLKISSNDIPLEKQHFLIAFTHSFIDLFQMRIEQRIPHEDYPPPILIKDIQLLDQVFII